MFSLLLHCQNTRNVKLSWLIHYHVRTQSAPRIRMDLCVCVCRLKGYEVQKIHTKNKVRHVASQPFVCLWVALTVCGNFLQGMINKSGRQ